MKKFFSILAIAAGCLFFASCSEDKYEEYVNSIQFVNADTQFESIGGTKTIEVTGQGITAAADDEWLSVSVSGNKITVTAPANTSVQSRHTIVKVKAANGDNNLINVSQLGSVLDVEGGYLYEFDNKARSWNVKVKHNLPFTAKSNADWIKASFDEEKNVLSISVDENNTVLKREGTVTVSSGDFTNDIKISQYDFMAAVLGDYDLFYLSSATATRYSYFPAKLTKTALEIKITNQGVDYVQSIPCTIDQATQSIKLGPCGSYTGKFLDYFVYLVYRSTEGYWTGYTNTSDFATATLEESEEEGYHFFDFEIAGTFGTRNIDALAFRAMKAESFEEANNAGYVVSCYYPILEKTVILGGGQEAKRNVLSPYIKR